MVGLWREVGPPDSEWGQTLRAASVCPRDAPGTAAPKNESPNYPVPKPPSGKGPKRWVCYRLGGGVGRSWSAGLGMGPNFASGLHVTVGCPGHSRAQKRPPECARPKTLCGKGPKRGVGYSLGGGVARSWSAGLGMGPNFASGPRVPAGCPGYSRGQKKAPVGPRLKTPCGKWPKRGAYYRPGGGVARCWSAGLGMEPNFASGLCVPAGCPGHIRAQKKVPEGPRSKTRCGKWPKRGVCYSSGGGVARSWSAGLGMGPNFASGLRVPAGFPGHSRAQKRPPEGPRPKPPCGKGSKRGVGYSLGGGVGRSWSAGLGWGQTL